MAFGRFTGDTPEKKIIQVKNDESAQIAVGTPVAFVMDGTDDGFAVVLPATAAAAKATTLLAGIVIQDPLPTALPKIGLAQIYGLCENANVLRQTRAATTDSFASAPAVAVGDKMVVETAYNCVSRSAAGAQSDVMAGIAAAQTLASLASSASNATDTRLAITTTMKVFLRLG